MITKEILQAAITGLEARRGLLDQQIEDLHTMLADLDGTRAAPVAAAPVKKKRVMSAAARKRISQAQKKRWREARMGR